MTVKLARRLLTVDEYHRMGEVGILTPADDVELINGELIKMSPIGSNHAACVKKLNALLTTLLSKQAIIGVQDPIHLSDLSEPEPDISILRLTSDFYATGHPKPKDVILLIEVADSSLEYDREIKIPLYAKAGIPECWIINLDTTEIEIYKQPKNEEYQIKRMCGKDDSLVLPALDCEISARQVF